MCQRFFLQIMLICAIILLVPQLYMKGWFYGTIYCYSFYSFKRKGQHRFPGGTLWSKGYKRWELSSHLSIWNLYGIHYHSRLLRRGLLKTQLYEVLKTHLFFQHFQASGTWRKNLFLRVDSAERRWHAILVQSLSWNRHSRLRTYKGLRDSRILKPFTPLAHNRARGAFYLLFMYTLFMS